MDKKRFFIGQSEFIAKDAPVRGEFVEREDGPYYRISNVHRMQPFLMSLVSDSDHWMFISSNGALTAGRGNPDNALFPYTTDDRIHDSAGRTGSKTVVFVQRTGRTFLWEPFSAQGSGFYRIERNLYKNIYGNRLIFEEINLDLNVVFSSAWFNSEAYGFIKESRIANRNTEAVSIDILDGIQNLMPYGLTRRFQMEYSTLADGYKKNELQDDTGLGIFYLSSIPVDKPEPSEALKATTVWSVGLEDPVKLISSRQVDAFREGNPVSRETDVRGVRGAYFDRAEFDLSAGSEKIWHLAADVSQDADRIAVLIQLLKRNDGIPRKIMEDAARGTDNLQRLVGKADGIQTTEDVAGTTRHFANTMFNVMRGGLFDDPGNVERKDFLAFVETANRPAMERNAGFLNSLPDSIRHADLLKLAAKRNDADLEKLCYEYLPLSFSRRHGDPSRPWNIFSIDIKDASGEKVLNYQGNWRDIFQNWEALARSFPGYVEGMIAKFVNASTPDGYNPYRVTRDGFDWEVLDPHDAWSFIGYWGDHQIIYLLKLLELSDRHHPGILQKLLVRDIFAYANVPYRIKPYEDLLADPHSTIDFDMDLERRIEERVRTFGGDGKLLQDLDGGVHHVNLGEKLLVPVLAKLSNFIPEAGIWLNTQRPEWNDANNALVGFGVSMVTLYYLRRHLKFCRELFRTSGIESVPISEEAAGLFRSIGRTFSSHQSLFKAPFSDRDRKAVLDELGRAGSDTRSAVYAKGFSGKRQSVPISELVEFFESALKTIDHSIKANRRPDGLYHAYNLMKVEDDRGISIQRMHEMLEGQVAVLSSGFLSGEESLSVLDALRQSALYREDQASYVLYPDRQLPRFVEKNIIPAVSVANSKLLKTLVERGDKRILSRDANGAFHFNGGFRNKKDLQTALVDLERGPDRLLVTQEKQQILDLFETLFNHRSFTGRSGTFYKYEGLGCIYWHMVSKLLLAAEETVYRAVDSGCPSGVVARLREHVDEIRQGIGVHKSPEEYGAFPTDPYSHTPGFAGVQQPGMTGQVKEDILSRWSELGLVIENGCIVFRPVLLRRDEFLSGSKSASYYDVKDNRQNIDLSKDTLMFTFCQVPIIYHLSDNPTIRLLNADGSVLEIPDLKIDLETSASIFNRQGRIVQIEVFLTPNA